MTQKVNVCSFYVKYEMPNEATSHAALIHNFVLQGNHTPMP